MSINKKVEDKKLELIYVKDAIQAIKRIEDYLDIETKHFYYQQERLERELGKLILIKRKEGLENADES